MKMLFTFQCSFLVYNWVQKTLWNRCITKTSTCFASNLGVSIIGGAMIGFEAIPTYTNNCFMFTWKTFISFIELLSKLGQLWMAKVTIFFNWPWFNVTWNTPKFNWKLKQWNAFKYLGINLKQSHFLDKHQYLVLWINANIVNMKLITTTITSIRKLET
jgi:hypothetical protein